MINILSFLLLTLTFIQPTKTDTDDPLEEAGKIKTNTEVLTPVADSLRLAVVPYPFFWIHKPVDFKPLSENAISITAGKGTDLYTFVDGNHYNNNAPKLLFVPDSNFIFSAKITPDFDGVYDGGAILLYTDSLNWAKLLFEKLDEKTLIIGSSVISDKRTDDSYHINTPDKAVWLKVAKSGKIFNFYHSLDGESWKLTRTFHYDAPEGMKVGFYAQSPKGPACTVLFSNIKYKGEAFTDFFTGD